LSDDQFGLGKQSGNFGAICSSWFTTKVMAPEKARI
jgi:hypothetical protein